MGAVPRLVGDGVTQAEVGAEVDDPHPALAQGSREGCRLTVRIGDYGRVDRGMAVEVELLELESHAVAGIEVREAPPHLRARGETLQRKPGVSMQQPRGQRAGE